MRQTGAEGIQIFLEHGAHDDAGVIREDDIGAVAVMNIEIENRNALQSMFFKCVGHANRHVIEEAESHGPIVTGVVTGRPDIAEYVPGAPGEYQVSTQYRGAGCVMGCAQRFRAHSGIWINIHQAVLWHHAFEPVEVAWTMNPQQLFTAHRWRVVIPQ